MQTTWNGAPVTLSLTEFWIVHALAKNPGHVKNRQQLMDAANVVLDDNTITSHIKRLRRKFIEVDPAFDAIQTVYGMGYRWSSEHPLTTPDGRIDTLILPWAGCQYARELESTLRMAQEGALEASADTIAHALAAEPQRVFRDADDTEPFSKQDGDSYVYPLHVQPLLDGYREDWDIAADPAALPGAGESEARILLANTDRYLFIYLEVYDPHGAAPSAAALHPIPTASTGWISRSSARAASPTLTSSPRTHKG